MPICSRTTKDSKEMIRELCVVELFELCETIPFRYHVGNQWPMTRVMTPVLWCVSGRGCLLGPSGAP